MKLNVLYCGNGWFDLVPILRAKYANRKIDVEVRSRDFTIPLERELENVHVVLPSNARFGASELAAAPSLRLIQQPAVGYEWIDLNAARQRDIPVCNAPKTNTDAVAQAAILLMLMLARRVPLAAKAFAEARIGSPLGVELTGRSLGIVGMGATGSRVAQIARSIGMKIESIGRTDGRDGFTAMLERSDFVSIHCSLNDSTRGMFDDRAFHAMRDGAFLINVSRGGVIHRASLENALDGGRLAGVGLDVFWDEPWDPHDPLFSRENVIVLPHIAGSTDASMDRIAEVVVNNTDALLNGRRLVHRVDL